jgi:hypothetical protein
MTAAHLASTTRAPRTPVGRSGNRCTTRLLSNVDQHVVRDVDAERRVIRNPDSARFHVLAAVVRQQSVRNYPNRAAHIRRSTTEIEVPKSMNRSPSEDQPAIRRSIGRSEPSHSRASRHEPHHRHPRPQSLLDDRGSLERTSSLTPGAVSARFAVGRGGISIRSLSDLLDQRNRGDLLDQRKSEWATYSSSTKKATY